MMNWEREIISLSDEFKSRFEKDFCKKGFLQTDFDTLFKDYYQKTSNLYEITIQFNTKINISDLEKRLIEFDEDFMLTQFSGIFFKRLLQNHICRLIYSNPERNPQLFKELYDDLGELFQLAYFDNITIHICNEFRALKDKVGVSLSDIKEIIKDLNERIPIKRKQKILDFYKNIENELICKNKTHHNYCESTLYEQPKYSAILSPSDPNERSNYLYKLIYLKTGEKNHFYINLNVIDELIKFTSNPLGLALFINKIVNNIATLTLGDHFKVYKSIKYLSQFKDEGDGLFKILTIYDELRKILVNEKPSYLVCERLPQIRDLLYYYSEGVIPKEYTDQESIAIGLTNAIKIKDTRVVNWYFEYYDGLPENIEEIIKELKVTFDDIIEYKKVDESKSVILNTFLEIVSLEVFVTNQQLYNLEILLDYLKNGAIDQLPFKKIINFTITKIELDFADYIKLIESLKDKMVNESVRYFCRKIRFRVRFITSTSMLEALNTEFFNDFNNDQIITSISRLSLTQYINIRDQLIVNSSMEIINSILNYLSRKFYDIDYLLSV